MRLRAGRFRRCWRPPRRWFWPRQRWGCCCVSEGYRPGDKLHFIYGLGPLLAIAYPYALRGEDGRKNLLYFSIGSTVVAALGIRAFMTGPS